MTLEQQIKLFTVSEGTAVKNGSRVRLAHPDRLLLVALGGGLAGNWLFYGQWPGLNVLLATVLLLAGLGGLSWSEGLRPTKTALSLVPLLLFFGFITAVRSNPLLSAVNIIILLFLFNYLLFFLARGEVDRLGMWGLLLIPGRAGSHTLVLPSPVVADTVDMDWINRIGRIHLWPLLRGMLLAVPIVAVFSLLLVSADFIFADLFSQLLQLEIFPWLSRLFWRGLLVMAISWLVAGGFIYALAWRKAARTDATIVEQTIALLPKRFGLGFVESGTILFLVNLLFAVFVGVQAAYLFGDPAQIELWGYTYAEYARRGFFELVTVAVLALGLILWLDWQTRRHLSWQTAVFKGLCSLTLLLVLVMLASAWHRLRLYEMAFGYTELRLYVYLFMVWLGLGLGWRLVTLWLRPSYFPVGLLLAAVGFWGTLNLINPDEFIVRQNVAHYQETGQLDVAYLTTLSDDALPALLLAVTAVAGDDTLVVAPHCSRLLYERTAVYDRTAPCEDTMSAILAHNLETRRLRLERNDTWRNWQSFNLARWRANRLLNP
jgi:hypothetical protein